MPNSVEIGKDSNAKELYASNLFYGIAIVLLVVQLALISWTCKEQFGWASGIPGEITAAVSTCVPAFLAGFSAYELIRLLALKRNPSTRNQPNVRGCLAMVVALLIIEAVLALLSHYFIYYAPTFTDVSFILIGVGLAMKRDLLLSFLTILLLCAGHVTSKNA